MALTKIIPRLHAALPLGRVRNPAIEALYLRLFFAYKRWWEDPFAGLAARRPELFRGGHILDIGANVGYTASLFARAVEPEYRVYAFEPESVNLARLRSIVRKRRLTSVEIIDAAVGDRDGNARLAINPHHPGDHRIATAEAEETIEVGMVTVDGFVQSRVVGPVAFVKIDVQGFELAVSRGMQGVLARMERIAVAFECSSDAARFGYAGSDLLDFYRTRGFALDVITHRGDLVPCTDASLAAMQRSRGYADVLASRYNPDNA